jgi:hypothetical protein
MADQQDSTVGENASSSTSRSYITSYNNLELTQLLNAKSPLTGLKVKIIPRFERTANQNNQEVAEDVLCHADFNLGGLDDNQLVIQTVPLIYILYVFPSGQNHQLISLGLPDLKVATGIDVRIEVCWTSVVDMQG